MPTRKSSAALLMLKPGSSTETIEGTTATSHASLYLTRNGHRREPTLLLVSGCLLLDDDDVECGQRAVEDTADVVRGEFLQNDHLAWKGWGGRHV